MLRALTGDSMNLRTTFPLPQPLRASSSGDCNGTVTVQSVDPRTLGRRHSPVATGYVGSAGGPVASVAAGWTRSLQSLAGAERQARRNYPGWLGANMAPNALAPGGLAPGPWVGAAPLVGQRGHHVQPAAGLAEPAGVPGHRNLVAGIGDRAQHPRPRLQQPEADRPARAHRSRGGRRVAQRVGQ